MTSKDVEQAINLGLDALRFGTNPDRLAQATENFYGLLALRSVCHALLGTEHSLYVRIDGYIRQNIAGKAV